MSQLNPPLTDGYAESAAARDKKRAKSVRWLIMPSTAVLFLWMAIPLAMTIWYSFSRYNLLNPDVKGFAVSTTMNSWPPIQPSCRQSSIR